MVICVQINNSSDASFESIAQPEGMDANLNLIICYNYKKRQCLNYKIKNINTNKSKSKKKTSKKSIDSLVIK